MSNLTAFEREIILSSWAEKESWHGHWWGYVLQEKGLGADAIHSRMIFAAMDQELPAEICNYIMNYWETKTARWERIAIKLEASLDRLATKL